VFTVLRPVFAALLIFHDIPANQPIADRKHAIDGLDRSFLKSTINIGNPRGKTGKIKRRGRLDSNAIVDDGLPLHYDFPFETANIQMILRTSPAWLLAPAISAGSSGTFPAMHSKPQKP
jgi:hypothetical protein